MHHRPVFRAGESRRGRWRSQELRDSQQHCFASHVRNLHSGRMLLGCHRCGSGSKLWQHPYCPESVGAPGAWLPPARLQRRGPTRHGATGVGPVSAFFFPISPLWTGNICPVTILPLCILEAQAHSWGICLRINLTLSLTISDLDGIWRRSWTLHF